MNRFVFFALMACVLSLVSCKQGNTPEQTPVMRGVITIDRQYGTPQPNFTAAEMISNGFAYGDQVRVQIGDSIDLIAPFVTAYTQAGIMGVSSCDYGAKGGTVDMGIANGNFHERVGGEDGDSIIITMHKKGGYLHEYELLQASYNNDPNNYATPEVFANFREVTTTGMGRKKLYRGSNPLNADKNPVRYAVMDSLARLVGIATEIDLADDNAMIEAQLTKEGYRATYCPALYRDGRVIGLKMGADTFSPEFKQKLAAGLRFMIANEPPYLIHCNEGKDRCGFVSLLLEALMGADVTQIEYDYMVTFENYYKYERDGEGWQLNRELNVDRMLLLLLYPELLNDITAVNWHMLMSSSPTMLYERVVAFLHDAGLSDAELATLKSKLSD